jgi:hypothetical protein
MELFGAGGQEVREGEVEEVDPLAGGVDGGR